MSRRVLLLFATTSLLVSACLKVNLDIEVRDDGSAEVSGIVALDADAVADLIGDFAPRDELCDGFLDEANLQPGPTTPGVETKPYVKDGFCGVEFTGQISPDQLESQLAGLAGQLDLTLRSEGDNWFFELPLGEEALGAEGFDDLGGLFDLDELLKDAEYKIRVKLPGRQIDHNADSIESDGTMVWDVDLLNPPERLFLQTEPGETITGDGDGGGGTGAILLIVALALVALGVTAYVLMRKKGEQGHSVSLPEPPLGDTATPAQATPAQVTSPTPDQATGAPVWDPARHKYVQWDQNGQRWLVYDDTSSAWKPE